MPIILNPDPLDGIHGVAFNYQADVVSFRIERVPHQFDDRRYRLVPVSQPKNMMDSARLVASPDGDPEQQLALTRQPDVRANGGMTPVVRPARSRRRGSWTEE